MVSFSGHWGPLGPKWTWLALRPVWWLSRRWTGIWAWSQGTFNSGLWEDARLEGDGGPTSAEGTVFSFVASWRVPPAPRNRTEMDRERSANFGLTKADWGQTWPSLAFKLGRSWGLVGRSRAMGAHVAACCGHVGSNRWIWPTLCRYAICANYIKLQEQANLFLVRGHPANTAPPTAEAAPDWQIGPLVPWRLRCGRTFVYTTQKRTPIRDRSTWKYWN